MTHQPFSQASRKIRVRDLCHDFGTEGQPMPVLSDVGLDLEAGELAILNGPSGSGKTTLLTLIGALRSIQRGSIQVLGHELHQLDDVQRVAVRRQLGFIFQAHNLFESLTALQNVRLALELHGGTKREIDRRAREALEAVGLGDRLDHKPQALSGGQRQRVAVARALAPRPALVLADEPTAALDVESAHLVTELLRGLGEAQGTTTLMVTHDRRLFDIAGRLLHMVDGRITSDVQVGEAIEICEFLTEVPAFAGLTPGAIAEIADQMTLRHYDEGEVIFHQGDAGNLFFLIRQGTVRIHDEDETRVLARLERGQFFGEVALISENPRNATAIAETEAELLTLTKEQFRTALARGGTLRDQLLQVYSTRQ